VQYDAAAGRLRKDVLPASPPRPPYSQVYHFTETDPIPNHTTYIDPAKVQERVARKYYPSPGKFVAPGARKRQVIIIGGGHNGLVSAAYLAKNGVDVVVLERRHIVGGAAVTEEIFPGFKFSRASYLAGLLRPTVIKELELEVRVPLARRLGVVLLMHRVAAVCCLHSPMSDIVAVLVLPLPRSTASSCCHGIRRRSHRQRWTVRFRAST
jgi:hypothetical protein